MLGCLESDFDFLLENGWVLLEKEEVVLLELKITD